MLAKYFGVKNHHLLNHLANQCNLIHYQLKKIPVVSKISAGMPIYAEENLIDYIYFATKNLSSNNRRIRLQVSGDKYGQTLSRR